MLYALNVPAITGFTSTVTNSGGVRNRGVDLEITSRNTVGNFKWNTSFNISNNKNAHENMIHINLSKEADKFFHIQVINTYDNTAPANHVVKSGGLGVQNLTRRLELLYPDKFKLDVDKNGHIFETTLKLQYAD